MAPRKSRTRNTAERMVKCKEQAEQNVEKSNETRKRRSPRGSNFIKRKESGESRCPRSEESVPASPVITGNVNTSKRNQGEEKEPSDIDLDMFVPETPMQSPSVVGLKRALAAKPLHLRLDNDEEVDLRGSKSRRVPSKKRKEFHTPPRDGVLTNIASPSGNIDAADYDPTLMPIGSRSLWNDPDSVAYGSNSSSLQSPLTLLQVTPVSSASKPNEKRTRWAHIRTASDNFPISSGSDPKSVAARELDVMTSYFEMLSTQLDVFKKKVQDHICKLQKEQLSYMREMHESLSSNLRGEMQDIKAAMDNLLIRSTRPSSGKVASKTSLAEWEKKLDDLTPHAKLIFSREVFARILSYNVQVKALEVYGNVLSKEGRSSCILGASIAVQSLIFSLQPREKKKHLSEGFGRLHSEFKYSVIQNVLYSVYKVSFDQLRSPLVSPDSSRDSSETLSQSHNKNRIARPEWLDTGYVKIPHIDCARAFVESPNQSRRSKVRSTPSSDDIASHGALRVYRLLGAHLYDGREYVRYAFFQSLGYLFVTWKDHVLDTDQSTLKMSFKDDSDLELDMVELPNTELCSLLANHQRGELVDAANMKVLKSLFAQWPGLVMEVQREVHIVSSTGSERRHSGGEKRILRKYINLIEVACDVLVKFTRVKNVDLFLRTHKNPLKCVMFAIVLRELSISFMELRRSSLSSNPKTEEIKVYSITLRDLIPGPNCQGSLLKSRCLRLTDSEFEKFNHRDELVEVHRREEAELTFQLSGIQESTFHGMAII